MAVTTTLGSDNGRNRTNVWLAALDPEPRVSHETQDFPFPLFKDAAQTWTVNELEPTQAWLQPVYGWRKLVITTQSKSKTISR